MKNYKSFITVLSVVVALLSTACTPTAITPDNSTPRTATHTITQLIADYATTAGTMTPVRPNSGTLGLYSVDIIPEGGADIIIAGRVVSDDTNGNMYKYITIQDLANPTIGLKISIDASGISSFYPMGQIVTIRCNGMSIGKYADMYQLGTTYFNNNADANKRGYEPGRMPLTLFKLNAEVHGMPVKSAIEIETMTLNEIRQAATDRTLHSRIVRIRNAYFNQKSQGKSIAAADLIFAPTTNGVGYPQSRDIEDGSFTPTSTSYISIATSEYARFAGVKIPSAEYKGDIIALIGWYRDKSNYSGNIQLTIRSLDDLSLFSEDDGTAWEPVYPY